MAAALVALGLVTGCTSTATEPIEETTTTTTTLAERPSVIRVALVVNNAAPTASADRELEAILTETVGLLGDRGSIEVELRTVTVDSPGQSEGVMAGLINDGVSVVISGCDDATVPAVIDAATRAELLAVTGCVSLPRPDLSGIVDTIDTSFFLDLSSLGDNAGAIASYAAATERDNIAVVRSNLVPDVEQTCLDLVEQAEDVTVAANVVFTELVDAPSNVASVLAGSIAEQESVNAIAICALAPSVGDVTIALREVGLFQPVITPWYSDAQQWENTSGQIAVLTPASRYGDDPTSSTRELFVAMEETDFAPVAVDVVAADVLAILVDAAERASSVGSLRIADAIRDADSDVTVDGISGSLALTGDDLAPVRREYRVVTIEDGGEPLVSAQVVAGG